jgi:uridine kinase
MRSHIIGIAGPSNSGKTKLNRELLDEPVRPSAEWFVYPTQKHADLTVSGEEPLERFTAAGGR